MVQSQKRDQADETKSLYMDLAIELAEKAATLQEIPVGAIVVYQDPQTGDEKIIGIGHNLREQTNDPSAHAEIVAMKQATQYLGYWRLHECTLYVTLEPCIMCAGAIVNARVKHLIYGCDDPKAGAVHSLYQIITDTRLNHRTSFERGLKAEQCASLLKKFFQRRRKEKKQEQQEGKAPKRQHRFNS